MRDFIYSLMTDIRKGPFFAIFKSLLFVVSLFYLAAIIIRGILYRIKVFKSEKVPLKIISVGNLTLGGTGKTPFVMKLAAILEHDLRKRSSILIRGYGWDEQAMLKRKLADTPILVGEDRAKSAHRSIKLYGSDTAILDDGFQYWELERDLDIVLVDAGNPFGNGFLFPRGVLREPVSAIKRASVVVLTKVDKPSVNTAAIKNRLSGINNNLVYVEAIHKPVSVYDLKLRKEHSVDYLKGKRIVLLSSIGDPDYFKKTAVSAGAEVAEHIVFADHHNYKEDDASYILGRCAERKFDLLLTTEKDEVKLRRMSLSLGNIKVFTLIIEMEIVSGKELLVDRLRRLYTR